MRFGRKEAELPLKMSKQDCAEARAKLPPVEPSLCAAQSLMAGMFNTFCRTELKSKCCPGSLGLWARGSLAGLCRLARAAARGRGVAASRGLSQSHPENQGAFRILHDRPMRSARQELKEATHFSSLVGFCFLGLQQLGCREGA